MPGFNDGKVSKAVQKIKSVLNRKEGGSSRSGGELHRAQEKIAELRQMLESKDREIARLRTKLPTGDVQDHSIHAENIIWMFGSGRTGSNWFSAMMGEITAHTIWQEPRVGALFAFYYTSTAQHQNEHFILGSPYKETWLTSLRSFVLEGADARFPGTTEQGYLVIREPTGSAGAPLLMEALPESRMIFLIRDPRDVVASFLDGSRKGGWLHQRSKGNWKQRYSSIDENPDDFVKTRANTYLLQVGRAKEAYEAHRGPKVLVTYENLRADTLGTMKGVYAALEIDVNQKELIQAVEKHAWEMIPEEHKGHGKFHRKASPGGWQEDLTPNQARIVEKITAPLLNEFYPA